MDTRGPATIFLGLWLSAALSAHLGAQDVLIDFEHYPGPDGVLGTGDDVPTPTSCSPCPIEPLLGQFTSVGVTFSQELLYYGALFPPGTHFISSTFSAGAFSVPVRKIAIKSNSFWTATLTAYDAGNAVLATSVLSHPSPGSFPLLGTLSVTTALPIARYTVFADDPSHIVNLDDLVFGPAPFDFFTLTPCRLVDTRAPSHGPPLAAGGDRAFTVVGSCGVPATAKALSLNVAVTEPSATGHVRLSPVGITVPLVSAINYGTGETRSNNAIVGLSSTGSLSARCVQASGTVHLILDVSGYFE